MNFPPIGEGVCCLHRLFPGKSDLPPTPAGNVGIVDSGQKPSGSPRCCCGSATPGQLPLLPSAATPSQASSGSFCFWFSCPANSVTICQVPRVIFAWWKCWPYCESILIDSHSKVVRQWGEFTTQADKAASIMCEKANNRKINAKQWDCLSVRRSQAQQCASASDSRARGVVGTSRYIWRAHAWQSWAVGACKTTRNISKTFCKGPAQSSNGENTWLVLKIKWSLTYSKSRESLAWCNACEGTTLYALAGNSSLL